MPKPLGEFEITVMAAVMHLGDEAYGARIQSEIETRGNRTAAIGAIYTTLSRLESKGLVASNLGEPTAVRGGRPKRFFLITPKGETVFRNSVASLGNMLKGLQAWPAT